MKASLSVLAVAAAASFLVPARAEAQLGDPSAPFCTVTDILTEFNQAATDCAGSFPGNPSQVGYDAIIGEIAEQGWGDATALGKIDEEGEEGSVDWDDVDFSKSGSISFGSPLNGDYIIALKGGPRFSLYYFASLVNVSSFDFTMSGVSVNAAGKPNGLSNVTVLAVRTATVPEPEGWALMLTALCAFGLVAVRRSRETA